MKNLLLIFACVALAVSAVAAQTKGKDLYDYIDKDKLKADLADQNHDLEFN